MSITSSQIAALAGVSRGTVDRVLNNRSGVKKETEWKVREIAERLGYVPNRAGKALSSSKRPLSIGFILNAQGNPFYDEVLRGIEDAKTSYPDFRIEYTMKKLHGYDVSEQAGALDEMMRSETQAIIITPMNHPLIAKKINEAVQAGVEVVTLNTDIEATERLVHVGCDYTASGRTAAGLMSLFAPRPACVGIVTGSLKLLGHNQRVKGFMETLETEFPGIRCVGTVENNDDEICSYTVVKSFLEEHPEVSAFYFTAAGVYGGVKAISECRAGNMPIIITCDDVEQTKQFIKSGKIQATVCQEPYRQGLEAVRHAIEYLITGKKYENSVVYMENQIKIAQNLR